MACSPSVLILDEATAYLDPRHRRLFLDLVETMRREGVTVLMTTQETAEMWRADRLVVLNEGVVVHDGPPGGILGDPDRCARLGIEPDPLVVLAGLLESGGVPVPPGRPTVRNLEEALARRGA
jgi:ABC-type multidrug transport system ATPase subunit